MGGFDMRWDRKQRVVRVQFDTQFVWLTEGLTETWRLPWENITRIGYATGTADPWRPDYFFVLCDNSIPPAFHIMEMIWDGVCELCEFVDKTKDVKYAPEGRLAGCVVPKTTTIWPPSESGMPLGLWEDV